jgi:uncharacterized protein (TIGR03083 family)
MTSGAEGLDDALASWKLERVAAALAEADALSPPDGLREAVLRRAAMSPRQLVDPVTPVELYSSRVVSLRQLLDTLDDDDWSQQASPYDWSVHGLLAHLLVIERYTAARFAIGDPWNDPVDEHLAIGAPIIAAEMRGPAEHTARRWSMAAQVLIDHIGSDRFDRDAPATLHGWPFSQWSALIARGFELWTHEDDIRAAIGRPAQRPSAGELRAMSSFSVSTLALVMGALGRGAAMAPTRIVLTGDGGATFDIGGTGTRRALLVADVVDYCKVVARRLDPTELAATIDGDAELVGHLLEASRAVAV